MNFKFHRNIFWIFIAAALFGAVAIISNGFTRVRAGQTDACLTCHEDKDLYADRNGKKVSLFVSPELYKKSVHSGAECSDCHENYNPDDLPHSKNPQKVNCNGCHSDLKNIGSSVHAKVNCSDCHSKHYIKPAKEFAKEQTSACLTCHNTKNVQGYKTSLHAKKNVGCDRLGNP